MMSNLFKIQAFKLEHDIVRNNLHTKSNKNRK
jgi:hypothetical protein